MIVKYNKLQCDFYCRDIQIINMFCKIMIDIYVKLTIFC